MYLWGYTVGTTLTVRDHTVKQDELLITSHQKSHWMIECAVQGEEMCCHFLSFTFQLSAHL